MKRRRIIRFLKVFLLVYSVLGIALYWAQDKLLLRPEALPTDHVFSFDEPYEELSIELNKTDTLNMVKFFPADSSRKGVVLYFHGNRQNIERYAPFAKIFTSLGYEVWMPDYPGFGKSRGEFTERNIYNLGSQVYKMAANKYAADSIVIYGKSLGTGVASYLASREKTRMLMLETPYYDIPSVVGSYAFIYPTSRMIKLKFPAHTYLPLVTEPVYIFHGTEDGVIWYRNAARLKEYLKPGDAFIDIEGAGHNDVNLHDGYSSKIKELLN